MKKNVIITSILILFLVIINAKELNKFRSDFTQYEEDLKTDKIDTLVVSNILKESLYSNEDALPSLYK